VRPRGAARPVDHHRRHRLFPERPIGTGPYRFVSEATDDRVVLKAFGQYSLGAPRNAGLVLKVYAYSISPEQGATMGVTGELVRRAPGADAGASATTVDARSYLRLGRRHAILAVRAAFGAAWGDAGTARLFYLGGSGPNANPIDFGSDGLNLLRGFDQNEFWGRRIAVVNVEYRVPLLRVERGIGTWPVFLRALHATGFFDAGKTWSNDFSLQPFERSLGAEVAAHLRLAYALPLTTAFGIAWPHDPRGFTRQPVVYFRLGHAF